MWKKLKFKRGAFEDVDPTPYRKASKKSPPKKANHKHTYEPVVLSYFNKTKNFSHEQGFTGGMDTCGGRRCTICGHLELGFPSDFEPAPHRSFYWERNDLKITYPDLPVVPVPDIWKL